MMAPSIANERKVRVLGLGNEILGDDAFGILVARQVRTRFGNQAEVVCSSDAGFNLLDDLTGVARLAIIDSAVTGTCRPGSVRMFPVEDMPYVISGSPHFIGLAEVLRLARIVGLSLPREIAVIAVETNECSTVGGRMHPDVAAAIPKAVGLVEAFLRSDPSCKARMQHG